MSNNITTVRLLAVPLENDYLHTFYFANASTQETYFLSKTVKSGNDFSYQRQNKVIRYPAQIDTILNCNYVMYKNGAYNNKWFYAFITHMEYVNDERTDITIQTDVMQTWLFDYVMKPSFVEREHVTDDTIGLHTFPEQLETGDYICNNVNKNRSLLQRGLVMGVTVDLASDDFDAVGGNVYGGVYSGVKYIYVTPAQANEIITRLAEAGRSEAIASIFTVPSIFVQTSANGDVVNSGTSLSMPWVNTLGANDVDNTKPSTINGYAPHNKKLLTFPYTYLLMDNNAGANVVYKYELFNSTDCDFNIHATITPSMSISLVPQNYNGVSENFGERINLGKFPICSWNNDVYTNWLTQNAINIPLSFGSGLLQIAGGVSGLVFSPSTAGISSLAGAGAIASGIMSITNSISEIYQHSLQPAQAEGNINSGDITYASGNLTFTAYQMSIKQEYAKIIDGYFDMYGYKVNTLKIPNKNHRSAYWFTKTINANIDGNIPNDDLQIIKQCYNNGITFWKSPTGIQNYNVNNEIV